MTERELREALDEARFQNKVLTCLAAVLLLGLLLALVWRLTASAAAQSIARDRGEVRAFRVENPCPATGDTRGVCPGWHVDHILPLCAGGLDLRSNMQWITVEDHRFKTLVGECSKLRRLANTPAK